MDYGIATDTLEYIDTTIKTKEDVEEFIGLTVAGVIPNENKLKR